MKEMFVTHGSAASVSDIVPVLHKFLGKWKKKTYEVSDSPSVSLARWLLVFPLIPQHIYLNQPPLYDLLNCTAETDLRTFVKRVGERRERKTSVRVQ